MEELHTKLVKGSKNQQSCLKKIKIDILGLTLKVESHANTIKQLEQQYGQMSATLNQCQSGFLLSSTVQNPKNDNHSLDITICSGKSTTDPPMPIVDETLNDVVDIDES